jgi:hypothetical protein
MQLFNYYNLDECVDRDSVFSRLDSLQSDGKIQYTIEGELVKIEDLDLEELDIKDLEKLFDETDVYPYLDLEIGDDDDFDDFDDEFDDDDDDY